MPTHDTGADSARSQAGKVIADRYEIIRALGRGGMGKVFLVRDNQTGNDLALKMLRSQYVHNQRAIERFAREVKAVRKLDHPCIVKIYDARKWGEQLFYTMEYVKGKSLRDWYAEKGRLPFGSMIRVLCMVANALEHAHKVTIHRDISPENIMVLSDGSVRLLDFGLAKIADSARALTMVGVSLGKLQYVAPEQRRNAAEVDQRADIYPIGVMFYELLTGQMPHPKYKFSALRPDLPKECDAFVAKAMADAPEDRYNTAAEVQDALKELYKAYKKGDKKDEETHIVEGSGNIFQRLAARWRGWLSFFKHKQI